MRRRGTGVVLGIAVVAVAIAAVGFTNREAPGAPFRRNGAVVIDATPVTADGWQLRVLDVRAPKVITSVEGVRTVSARESSFVVVDVEMVNLTPGTPLGVTSGSGVLRGADGVDRAAVGGGEDPICANCVLVRTFTEPLVVFSFVFELPEPLLEDTLAFFYSTAEPMRFSLAGSIDEGAGGGAPPPAWARVAPGGDTTCARGDDYAFWFRRGSSDELLVFFQAGGGCFDANSCAPGSLLFDHLVNEEDVPPSRGSGVLELTNPANPFRRYSMLFVPSCSGDVHWGDAARDYVAPDGTDFTIQHRGFVNASAALAHAYREVPDPSRVVVSGCSAGSIGSLAHVPYVIEAYPDAEVVQIGDSFAGVYEEPPQIQEDYAAHDNFPDWIPELAAIDPEQFRVATFYDIVAAHYPDVTFSQINFVHDEIQSLFYEEFGGDPEEFPAALLTELEFIHQGTPNFRSFTVDLQHHCILPQRGFYTLSGEGSALRDWVAALAVGEPVTDVRCAGCAS